MSTDLVPTVIHPYTGEAISLPDAPDALLARLLDDVREYKWQLDVIRRLVSEEALKRMDQQAKWTLPTAEGFKLKSSSPAPTEEFDAAALHADLCLLVDEGVISAAAAVAAVETIVDFKARKRGIDALRKLGGRVADTVNKHARTVDKNRYVSVERTS